jgi:hypothetical protein
MRKQFKGFILGVLFMALLIPTVGVLANTVTQSIDVQFRNIRIFMDGDELIPRDGAGNQVQPFMFAGTTYLPVRAIADAFGKNVSWDSANGFIHLNTPERTGIANQNIITGGTNFRSATDHPSVQTVPSNMDGRTFSSSVQFHTRPDRPAADQRAWVEANLGGNYSTLNATIGRMGTLETRSEFTATITFIGDGRTLDTFTIDANDPYSFDVSVNVSGVNTLRIETVTTPEPGGRHVVQVTAIGGFFYP